MAGLLNPREAKRDQGEAALVRVLCDINYALTSADDWQGRVRFALDQLSRLLPLDLAALLLVDGQSRLFVYTSSPAATGLVETAKASLMEHYRLLTGQIPDAGGIEAHLLEKTGEDASARQALDSSAGGRAASYMSLPLLGVDEMLGVIHISSFRPEAYEEEDLSLFSVVAAQLANYMAHLRLHQALEKYDRERDASVAEVLHELKNPLTSARGFSQLALRRLNSSTDPEAIQGRELLGHVDAQLTRVAEIAEGVLDASGLRSGWVSVEREQVDLSALAESAAEAVRVTTDRHRVEVKAGANCLVWGDKRRLEQVLHNLLSNAVKYSPRGGTIEVTAERNGAEQVMVAVKDQGMGISPEEQSHLFQRYYRADTSTRRKVGGSGLGLYICSEIVRRHGGQISVESEAGKGSTFYFSLPAA